MASNARTAIGLWIGVLLAWHSAYAQVTEPAPPVLGPVQAPAPEPPDRLAGDWTAASADGAGLMAQALLGSSLAGGSVGVPSGPPRLFEASWQVLLLPTLPDSADLDPVAPALRAALTAYAGDSDLQVDLRFSRPVNAKLGRDGNWATIDVPGFVVEVEQTADLGQRGSLQVRARPGDRAGTVRLGCATDGTGRPKLESLEGGRLVRIVLAKPKPRSAGDNGDEGVGFDLGSVLRTEEGQASWYGSDWHGRLTANGERFNMNAMTAAHKTIRLGTWVRVTNLRNGKQVVVRINDRGPYIRGRIIDLSYAAAGVLGFIGAGVAPVRVEVLSGKP